MEAYDLGTPTPLSTDLDLIIYVRNINDYEPQFLVDVFNINFTEEQAPGSETVQLPETIDKDEVDDLDDPPTQVCYFIINGNDDGLFVLDIFKHELTVRLDLDAGSMKMLQLGSFSDRQDIGQGAAGGTFVNHQSDRRLQHCSGKRDVVRRNQRHHVESYYKRDRRKRQPAQVCQ